MRSNSNVLYLCGLMALLFACTKDIRKAPLLEIVSPADNAEIFQGPGYAFHIQVNANDPDGLIKTVDLKIDNNIISQLKSPPYSYSWQSMAAVGNHILTATATDNDGLSSSVSITIKVKSETPSVTTLPVAFVGTTFAICASHLASMGIPRVTVCGICWNKTGSPTIADTISVVKTDTGSYTSSLSELQLGTTYYVRAFAYNSNGAVYGDQVSFTTATAYSTGSGSVVDPRDLQSYQWVKIGNQVWMAENLRYNASGSMYYPNASDTSYGRLYPNYSLATLAPPGWHIPSKDELQELYNFVGGTEVAGGFLKETGNAHWISPNLGASDLANFHALPAGSIYTKYSITAGGLGSACRIWSSDGYLAILNYDSNAAVPFYPNSNVIAWELNSVRCIKN